MLAMIRKCPKEVSPVDVPENLIIDSVSVLDSYLVRARDAQGMWREGYLAYDHGAKPSDVAVYRVLYQRRNLLKHRVIAANEAMEQSQQSGPAPSLNKDEIVSVKDAGLNFNALCLMWLADVDVNEKDFPSVGNKVLVPKFLNRLLGLSLSKQRLGKSFFLRNVRASSSRTSALIALLVTADQPLQ